MDAIRRQFFLAFAVLGAFVPYFPVWLEARGLDDKQVGEVLSMAGLAVMGSPLLATLVADTRVEPRRVLGGLMLLVGVGAGLLLSSHGFWPLLGAYLLFTGVLTPVLPMQDAALFSIQRSQAQRQQAETPYHRVRAYGTAGFIVPSLGLWVYLEPMGGSLDATVWTVVGCALLAAVNTLWLPPRDPVLRGPAMTGVRAELPTLAALRRVMRRDVLVFAAAAWLLMISNTAYHGFYPLLLGRPPEQHGSGFTPAWLGLISSFGVLLELPLILAFGWMLRRLGLRRLMVLGGACLVARMGLLWWTPTPVVAIGTQLFHGITVVASFVVPPIFINRFAEERYRASMQGLYVVVVGGTSRIVGSVTAGWVANASLAGVFLYGMLAAVAATLLLALAFHPDEEAPA